MNTYGRKPDSYIERLPLENSPSNGTGWGIAGFVGTAISGPTDKAVYVESFKEFADVYGKGSSSPYMTNSNLAYAVYDFFECGGAACFIARAIHAETAVKAKATDVTSGITVTAKDFGTWANGMSVAISANEEGSGMFDIRISLNGEDLSIYTRLSNEATDEEYWVKAISEDPFVEITADNLSVKTLTLADGVGGASDISDSDITSALALLNDEDVTWVAIPGETSSTVTQALKTFVDVTRAGKTFAVIDTPLNSTVSSLKTFAKGIPTDMGACFAPWGVVVDQLTGAKRNVPPSGAVLGNFSASVSGRGIAKTPAGVGSVCKNWLSVTKMFTDSECGTLNSSNVNCIVPQPGYGICIWGSRVLQENKKQNRKFISQSHIDLYMDKALRELTLFTVFEVVNDDLMERTRSIIKAFMTELFNAGCFVGAKPDEAFDVICDWSINKVNDDVFNIQVGYAKTKPNEFTLITIKQRRAS